ncbi:MAG: PSD1 and planctomycete cytochrome C domain-containing protein [Verrucomicrobia bacterium]|nr:PSD1 and planctomycete cytochrome C domain-containing protein [Verrucomicrobiota bacterium]
MRTQFLFVCTLLSVAGFVGEPIRGAAEAPLQFNRDIRPILSDNCFSCHGPDEAKRKAKLRLDKEEGALADLGGYQAVLPGQPSESELIRRIVATDPDELMPPAKSGKKLTPEQVSTLRSWIAQGAQWQEHWAYLPPQRVEAPGMSWFANPIDYFVSKRLGKEGVEPSSRADKVTQIRRVTLSLTGLPPTPDEVESFLQDASSNAYEKVVDRLLGSPRFGEHMARYWLDEARYGDTHGLHLDNERSIWPYRDWVIRAFNDNKPFDDFTVEQLAGDLLPNPTRDQLVATGFNRCNVTTSEGGAIPEEFAVRYAVDRVSTMATVWMGTTAGCAVCHDHKFDPLLQREFYSLYDFFNDLDENPMDGNALLPPPTVRLATPEQDARLKEFEEQIALVQKVIHSTAEAFPYEDPLGPGQVETLPYREFVWVAVAPPEGAKISTEKESWEYASRREAPVRSESRVVVQNASGLGRHFFTESPTGLNVGVGDRLFVRVYLDPKRTPREIAIRVHDGKGWSQSAFWGEDLIDAGAPDSESRHRVGELPSAGQWVRLEVETSRLGLQPGARIRGMSFDQFDGRVYWDQAGIVSRWPQAGEGFDSLLAWQAYSREQEKPPLPEAIQKAVKSGVAAQNAAEKKQVREYFVENVHPGARSVFGALHDRVKELTNQRNEFDRSILRSLITRDRNEPIPAHVLKRGEYDKPGEEVHAGVPAVFPPLPEGQPTNRLGLARWLVSPEHPLTARVTVNRMWQQHFGIGLVRTAEDFGSQGEPPSHPELLDWLATEFVARDWDVKAMHKLIVMSATYRQDSRVRSELRDPENRLHARGPRFRLDAESIRDSVLAISGLLVEEIGGKGVKPYQPPGIWKEVAYTSSNTSNYKRDSGDALFRRSVYIFWKRTAPPPMMRIFDAPTREACQVRRERTNTPLQALALLNETLAIESARHMARRMIREGGGSCAARVAYGFRLATGRTPDVEEQQTLNALCDRLRADYEADPGAARKLLEVGESRLDPEEATPELAAYTMVANTLLNLSETITLN